MTDTPDAVRIPPTGTNPAPSLRFMPSQHGQAYARARHLTELTGVEWTAEYRNTTGRFHVVLTPAALPLVTSQTLGAAGTHRSRVQTAARATAALNGATPPRHLTGPRR